MMLKLIKTMLLSSGTKEHQNEIEIGLSEQELRAISGAGAKTGAVWTDPF